MDPINNELEKLLETIPYSSEIKNAVQNLKNSGIGWVEEFISSEVDFFVDGRGDTLLSIKEHLARKQEMYLVTLTLFGVKERCIFIGPLDYTVKTRLSLERAEDAILSSSSSWYDESGDD